MDKFQIDDEYELKLNKTTTHWDVYKRGELLSKSTEKLYKFHSLTIQNIDALLNHYFYLSDPGNFNDPFDCNINLIEDLEKIEDLKTVKRNTYKNIAVASFSETIDNHLMWAHYTNNYKGFALEFAGNEVSVYLNRETIKRHTLTRVIYPSRIPKIQKDYLFAQHYVFTTKMKHWEYEKEWRIITELETENENNRCLQYVPECLKGLYVGHQIPDTDKSSYRLLLSIMEIKFPNIPIYVVYPHSTDLKLEFHRVRN